MATDWTTLAFSISTLGLFIASLITFWSTSKALSSFSKHNRVLEITRKNGHLVEIISIDAIDQEDPEKLERALEEVKKAKKEVTA